jgi:hypothetical protein
MYGYFIKRTGTDFVINVELTQFGSGYNVVPKEIDPWNKYDITEIQAYTQEHPEMEVVWNEEQGVYIPIEV